MHSEKGCISLPATAGLADTRTAGRRREKEMSGKCYQCPKGSRPKTVTIHVEMVNGQRVISYLCAACRKELGLCVAPKSVPA